MPKVKKDSLFISIDDVKTNDLIKFLEEGEEVEKEFQGKSRIALQITIMLKSGDKKLMTLNGTSKANMIDAYGDDTAVWIGKYGRVEIANQKIGKDFKDVLYITSLNKNLKGEVIPSASADATTAPDDVDIKAEDLPFQLK